MSVMVELEAINDRTRKVIKWISPVWLTMLDMMPLWRQEPSHIHHPNTRNVEGGQDGRRKNSSEYECSG